MISWPSKGRGAANLGAVRVFYMAGAPDPAFGRHTFMRQGIKTSERLRITENSSTNTPPDG